MPRASSPPCRGAPALRHQQGSDQSVSNQNRQRKAAPAPGQQQLREQQQWRYARHVSWRSRKTELYAAGRRAHPRTPPQSGSGWCLHPTAPAPCSCGGVGSGAQAAVAASAAASSAAATCGSGGGGHQLQRCGSSMPAACSTADGARCNMTTQQRQQQPAGVPLPTPGLSVVGKSSRKALLLRPSHAEGAQAGLQQGRCQHGASQRLGQCSAGGQSGRRQGARLYAWAASGNRWLACSASQAATKARH